MSKDHLGEKLREHELRADAMLTTRAPVVVRVEGREFREWSRGCDRPFDARVHAALEDAMRSLGETPSVRYLFGHSDEIVAVMAWSDPSDDARPRSAQATASEMASRVTVAFNHAARARSITAPGDAIFTATAYNVPTPEVARDVLFWRESAAVNRSVIGYAARSLGSDTIRGLSLRDVRDKLRTAGMPWGRLDAAQKFGSAFARRGDGLVAVPSVPLKWNVANPVGIMFDGCEVEWLSSSEQRPS